MKDRRTKLSILFMAGAQAMLNSTTSILISSASFAALLLLGEDKTLATLPATAVVTGTALATIPASYFMKKAGRKPGFIFGILLGIMGAAIAAYSIYYGSFVGFTIGAMIVGTCTAFGNYYRFAAVDVAGPEYRSKAVSYVMAGGLVAGFIGPQIASNTKELFLPYLYLGPYLAIIALGVLALFFVSQVKIPKMEESHFDDEPRPLMEILKQPTAILAILSAMIGYAGMSFVMIATPLAIIGCGLLDEDSFNVISWHVVAMFGPSFFTGSLIARYGDYKIIMIGALLGVACVFVALSGVAFSNFWVALVLLGVSWNFMFVGGTTLLTTTYRPSETAKVQGFNDFLVFGTVATASLSAGILQQTYGWDVVNYSVLPFFILVVVIAFAKIMGGKKEVAAAE
ncbi:MFS transporter [Sneathiella sp. P13V-1]|uniref:MFS transporter n=1 Tax=Sneathiella sp. P13V-1 TaxID=2697366 RepID=UPI00187B7BFA|nr:MFS transporter [Sneathiella sp. P13V-1]MBE7636926.1 MFS transporter [Sneathiella sp. P13V-1]